MYIGSNGAGEKVINVHKKREAIYRIVSCSNIIPLKRVNLIVGALGKLNKKRPDLDIEWIHFGDGEEKDVIEKMAKTVLN